ncbi:hypothetical protein FRC02_009124 [Tulasnella sp. 418]|nr:hypothetical protein FRC02_009124 [Tulasnella sp. 418]
MSDQSNQAESNATQLLKDRRFKLSRACDRCRRRRIKCDEGHPCKSCIHASSDCTFEEIGKKTVPHKSRRSTLEDRMQQLESLIHALPSSLFSTGLPPELNSLPPTAPGVPPSNGPQGVPPPSLATRTLVNPSRYFHHPNSPLSGSPADFGSGDPNIPGDSIPLALSSSYLYLDDQGSTRWQGEMSGFPLLDLLLEKETTKASSKRSESPESSTHGKSSPAGGGGSVIDDDGRGSVPPENWFPDRKPTKASVKPEAIWKLVTSGVEPDLMDSLVKCFLSTTFYLMPFIHVPTFLADYADPEKWDTGFASFIIAICCLTSRHVDDIRVRAEPHDPFSSGSHWFALFTRLRALPGADRPTLYTVQAVLVAAVYAIGLGKLSKGLALLSEAVTLCIDAGLHRSVAAYDYFDPIETEVRKRTFWSVYAWDKQAAAYFGRPPMIRLRDCDVPEPEQVDDEYITKDGIGVQPAGVTSLMSAFVNTNRLYIIVEGVLDVHPVSNFSSPAMSFLARASSTLSGFRQSKDLREAESLLNYWCESLPAYWAVTAETMSSKDVVRITQAERLHCLEHFIRMLIYRYRFSIHMSNPSLANDEGKEVAMRMAQRSALQIIAKHLEISSLGLMTYYGVRPANNLLLVPDTHAYPCSSS